jgi:hypothetical protein
MILGATRTPFQRPAGASPNFQPKLPNSGFFTHFHPLTQVTHAMTSAAGMYRPAYNNYMGPSELPAVPLPAPPVVPVAPVVPKAGGVAGSGFGGFGSTGGTMPMGHSHVDPYMVMRAGVIPGVSPSGSNIRNGVRNAGQRIQRSMPFQTAPLAPEAAPPAVTPVVVAVPTPAAPLATGIKGFLGAVFGVPRRRSHRFIQTFIPAPVNEQCERIGPRRDGLFVTICGGRVTQYSDAQGNVRQNPYAGY